MDKLTVERRSWNMGRIKGRDTEPERRVRSWLHRLGYRFSLKRKDLPGYPDVVLSKHKVAVFVHGCFWHRHMNCRNAVLPKTRPNFWLTKLNGNVERDQRNEIGLRHLGWKVLTIWECEVQDEVKLWRALRSKLSESHHA